MAGTDARQALPMAPGPAVVLVEPQLGENIGMVARAMLNGGLTDLRLVRPREPWPNDKARAAASGADVVIDGARLFETTSGAIADLACVFATTARDRSMTKRTLTPRQAAAELRALSGSRSSGGLLFGKESKGLHNDDVALADAVVTVPLNPAFRSLNLAMAVLLLAYEWWLSGETVREAELVMPKDTRLANKAELVGLFEHLEGALDECGFLRVREKRPIMVRNLRNLLGRASLTEQEVRTLRGVIACLSGDRKGGAL